MKHTNEEIATMLQDVLLCFCVHECQHKIAWTKFSDYKSFLQVVRYMTNKLKSAQQAARTVYASNNAQQHIITALEVRIAALEKTLEILKNE